MTKEMYQKIRTIVLNYWAMRADLEAQFKKDLKILEDKKTKYLKNIIEEWDNKEGEKEKTMKEFWKEYRKAGRYYGKGSNKIRKEVQSEDSN